MGRVRDIQEQRGLILGAYSAYVIWERRRPYWDNERENGNYYSILMYMTGYVGIVAFNCHDPVYFWEKHKHVCSDLQTV